MVTGRVCKNILGLFSNGIKETLEVKLKLIPVPTCMQREYVENMERYHSLSQLMPEGLDYNAWADFLKTNPTIQQLAHSTPSTAPQNFHHDSTGDFDMTQQMHTQPMPLEAQPHPDQHMMPYDTYGTRVSSPAMSTASFNPYNTYQDSRPASRASVRSETGLQAQAYPSGHGMAQDQEEGPPKKRARVTKATRPKKTALGANNDSLRVTASTAASVRLHKPVGTGPTADIASMEQVPRAPTPRPGNRRIPQPRGVPRLPAPSLLRHASMDDGRPSLLSFESAMFSDAAIDSADDERGISPGDTPMDIPSSPPVMPSRVPSSAPSSPGLPSHSYPTDSGFVSDMSLGREDAEIDMGSRAWEGSDLPTVADTRPRRKMDRSHFPWTEVTPGPPELLPKSYVPKPKTYPRARQSVEKLAKVAEEVPPPYQGELLPSRLDVPEGRADRRMEHPPPSQLGLPIDVSAIPVVNTPPQHNEVERKQGLSTISPFTEPYCQIEAQQVKMERIPQHSGTYPSASQGLAGPDLLKASTNDTTQPPSRSATPNPPPKRTQTSNPRGLPRSYTWSGEPMSDAAVPVEAIPCPPRSGPGAKRKHCIADKLQRSIAAGEMPTFCNNCGEIETPTWRKAFTRVESGSPEDVQISSEGNGIVAYEVMAPSEEDDSPRYRIFKQVLTQEEKDTQIYQSLTLCNRKSFPQLCEVPANPVVACGLWLNKKNAMRPMQIWQKKLNPEKPKRRRNPPKSRKKTTEQEGDEIQSDAAAPYSEPITQSVEREAPPFTDGSNDATTQPSMRSRTCSFQAAPGTETSQMDDATALAALHRAIQSSPVSVRGSKESPIDLEPDLTPKPTRRLLFPSPRKAGEVKSLDDSPSSSSPTKGRTSVPAESVVSLPDLDMEGMDKENCPPVLHDDDIAHLFEEHLSPKTTPTKGGPLQDLLKTPTPGSRRRNALTPRRGAENNAAPQAPTTPSRSLLTPSRGGRATTIAPETPFTRQLNALLAEPLSSPSQAIDFSAFPTLILTPGRSGTQFTDFNTDDFLSSDLPMPSSPPGGLGFSLYEDPATSTIGLWSGASIFEGSDAMTMEEHQQQSTQQQEGSNLKTAEISVDFAAMIEGVVGSGDEKSQSPELKDVAKPATPEAITQPADTASPTKPAETKQTAQEKA